MKLHSSVEYIITYLLSMHAQRLSVYTLHIANGCCTNAYCFSAETLVISYKFAFLVKHVPLIHGYTIK